MTTPSLPTQKSSLLSHAASLSHTASSLLSPAPSSSHTAPSLPSPASSLSHTASSLISSVPSFTTSASDAAWVKEGAGIHKEEAELDKECAGEIFGDAVRDKEDAADEKEASLVLKEAAAAMKEGTGGQFVRTVLTFGAVAGRKELSVGCWRDTEKLVVSWERSGQTRSRKMARPGRRSCGRVEANLRRRRPLPASAWRNRVSSTRTVIETDVASERLLCSCSRELALPESPPVSPSSAP